MRPALSPAASAAGMARRTAGRLDALLLGLVLCLPIPLLAVTGITIPLPGGVVEAFASIVPGGGDAALRASQPTSVVEAPPVVGTPDVRVARGTRTHEPSRLVRGRVPIRQTSAPVARAVGVTPSPVRSATPVHAPAPPPRRAVPVAVSEAATTPAPPTPAPAEQPAAPVVEPRVTQPVDVRPEPTPVPEPRPVPTPAPTPAPRPVDEVEPPVTPPPPPAPVEPPKDVYSPVPIEVPLPVDELPRPLPLPPPGDELLPKQPAGPVGRVVNALSSTGE